MTTTWIAGGLPGTYMRLAKDNEAQFGIKPSSASGPYWRQSNCVRYIRAFQSRRSLLVWKVFGRRMDGLDQRDHPTEAVPGNPAGLSDEERNMADNRLHRDRDAAARGGTEQLGARADP
jgi:hypothetical protein